MAAVSRLAPETVQGSASAPRTSSPPGRVSAGLCGIFLGAFGIHKFILGYQKPAFIMLGISILTCGYGGIVIGIIGMIEGIIYLTKSDEEFIRTYVTNTKEWF